MMIKFDNPITVNPGLQTEELLKKIATQMKVKNCIEILDRLLEHGKITEELYVEHLEKLAGK